MSSNRKGTILVVDDDRLVLATLAHGLSQAGYDVIDADNGDDAILLAREHRPDLALLDIRMQGKSGFDVAAYLREHSQMPFMFLSAFSDERTVAQVKALGAVAYLVKPLDINQILPVVDKALSGSKAQLPEPRRASKPAAAEVMPAPEVLMAVGVLMHRHALTRVNAFEHLHRLARAEARTVQAQAELLLDAVEVLAQSGQTPPAKTQSNKS
ncbi:MAG TPA: response regulator [Burkholderiaceae bacterium]|jgi:response regulator NasT